LLKGGAWLGATAAIAAVIFLALYVLVLKDSRAGTTPMGKVAYVRDGDVWVKELPNGSNTRLTNWGDVLGDLQWSASGEWLSVTRRIPRVQPTPPPGLLPGPEASDDSSWIIDADGKQERQLDGSFVPPSWSPVKDEFAIGAEVQAADGSNQRAIFTSNSPWLISTGGPRNWTPSGEWIVATLSTRGAADFPPTQALVRVRPDGSEAREFYRFDVSECSKRTWIARAGSCHGSATAEGDERIPLGMAGVLTDTDVIGVVGTPDETLVPLPANPVRTIPLDAANGLVTGGGIALGSSVLAYSPESGRLAEVGGPVLPADEADWRIALVELTTGKIEYVTALGEAAVNPSWSPDGTTLFFAAADGSLEGQPDADPIASRRIWSADADGSNRKQLTSDPRYRDEYPQMTPDGNLLFTRIDLETEGNAASLWLLELATGQLTMVVDRIESSNPTMGTSIPQWQRIFDWWHPS
jgi:dipeptidyl aminopeptidase/acylaminoacyl peptidase